MVVAHLSSFILQMSYVARQGLDELRLCWTRDLRVFILFVCTLVMAFGVLREVCFCFSFILLVHRIRGQFFRSGA